MYRTELNTVIFIMSVFLLLFINDGIVKAVFGYAIRDYFIGLYIVVFIELVIFSAVQLLLRKKKE